MKLGLQAFYEQSDMDFQAALPFLNEKLMQCLGTDDAREGLMSFMEKREPNWPSRA